MLALTNYSDGHNLVQDNQSNDSRTSDETLVDEKTCTR